MLAYSAQQGSLLRIASKTMCGMSNTWSERLLHSIDIQVPDLPLYNITMELKEKMPLRGNIDQSSSRERVSFKRQ